MATRKTKSIDPLFDTELPAQAEIDIEDFLEEWAPDTVVVEIYQYMKDGSRPHQERLGIEILKSDLYGYLRENYGGGKFELQFKDRQRRIRKSLTVTVGAGPKAGQPVAPNGKPASNDYMSELMLALIASLKPAPAQDLGSMMTGLAAMLSAMQPKTQPDSAAAMLQAMATTFTSLKPKETDSLAQFKEMVTLTKDLMPDSKQPIEENMYTVAKELGQKALDAFSGRAGGEAPRALPPGAQVAPPVRMIQAPAGNGVTGQPGAPTEAPKARTQQENIQDWIRVQLGFLKQKAAANKDAGFWIDYIFENEEEPGCAAILAALEGGASFEDLLQFDPDIAQNPALNTWFRTLYDGLRAEVDKVLDSAGRSGDAGHAGSDAKASTSGQPDDGSPKPSGTTGESSSGGTLA